MSDTRYLRALKQAYCLELLGEAAYRHGSWKPKDRAASAQWYAFADTESEMQALLSRELERVGGVPIPSVAATRLARWLGWLARLLNPAFLARIIRRVLDRRRYSHWAAQFGSRNPRLWQALVEHELKQVAYFGGGEG